MQFCWGFADYMYGCIFKIRSNTIVFIICIYAKPIPRIFYLTDRYLAKIIVMLFLIISYKWLIIITQEVPV